MMLKKTYAAASLLAMAVCGCGDGQDPAGTTGTEKLTIGAAEGEALSTTLYQMPTPNELFSLVRNLMGEGDRRLMSNVGAADRYVTTSKRALNFGVYATDLVYASQFNRVEVARYYLTVKDLGSKLGLSGAFDAAIQSRLDKNVAQGDSLEVISNEAYYKAYEKLQDEDMGPALALVLAGGWVESMHLVIMKAEATGNAAELKQRVADQKPTLEHLVELMEEQQEDPAVADVLAQLKGIRDIYDRMEVKRVPTADTSASGRMVLGDNTTVAVSDGLYQQLGAAVEAVRAAIVAPEDVPTASN